MKIFACLLLLLSIYMVNGDNTSDIKTLKSSLQLLLKRIELKSSYCSAQAQGQCGACICKDDFNLPKKYYCDCRNQSPQRDCLAHRQNGMKIDGYYTVTMNGYRTTQVYCDQTTSGGGWTVIQRRMDGSTNFYRTWEQYKIGFGQLHHEFWQGNEDIHVLCAQALYPKGSEAMIQIKVQGLDYLFTNQYSHFEVGSERSNYLLQVSGPSGHWHPEYFTRYENKVEFSTWDKDNDGATSYKCAYTHQFSGWWINGSRNSCTTDEAASHNLNGPYDKYRTKNWYNRITFFSQNQPWFSEIKVRRKI
uniref:Fibrinogen C-terminal domain-containing protein n=1 Tax=Clytia hemisphaerica TaxID=252671 RepID=A0A7M5WKI7_9CNID